MRAETESASRPAGRVACPLEASRHCSQILAEGF